MTEEMGASAREDRVKALLAQVANEAETYYRQGVLEDILEDTMMRADAITADVMSEWAAMPDEELFDHAIYVVENYLASNTDPDEGIGVNTFIGLYMAGFINGRLYEERRDK